MMLQSKHVNHYATKIVCKLFVLTIDTLNYNCLLRVIIIIISYLQP